MSHEPCEHVQEVIDFMLDYEERTPVKLKVEATCNICHIHCVLDEEGMAVHDKLTVKLFSAVNDAIRRTIAEDQDA